MVFINESASAPPYSAAFDLKIIKAITGAETINISLSGNMACVLALSGSRGFTIDSQGNIAYQYALNAGGGLPSLGVGLSIMRSSEPTYSELEGWAAMIGGSVAPGMGFGATACPYTSNDSQFCNHTFVTCGQNGQNSPLPNR